MTEPNQPVGTDVHADPDDVDRDAAPLTTDPDQQSDDLDPNEGEGGSG
jgi:hypothetical protein